MATVRQYETYKVIVETEAERAKREFASLGNAAVREAKKISLAFDGDNWSAAKPVSNSTIGQLGSLASFNGGIQNFARITAASTPLADSISRLKKVGLEIGEAWRGDLAESGRDVAASIRRELLNVVMDFERMTVNEHIDSLEQRMNIAKHEGAIEMLSAGSDIGGKIGKMFGSEAIGSLIGGGIGGVAGWFLGGEKESIRQRNELSSLGIEHSRAQQERILRFSERYSDWGLEEMMSRQGSRTGRLNLLEERYAQLTKGGGENSLKNLHARYSGMSEGERLSSEGQKIYSRIIAQQGRADELLMRIQQTKAMPMFNPVQAGYAADEYTRKGLYVGAQVDVRDVNKDILAQLKIQTEIFRKAMENPFEHGRYGDDKNYPTLF